MTFALSDDFVGVASAIASELLLQRSLKKWRTVHRSGASP